MAADTPPEPGRASTPPGSVSADGTAEEPPPAKRVKHEGDGRWGALCVVVQRALRTVVAERHRADGAMKEVREKGASEQRRLESKLRLTEGQLEAAQRDVVQLRSELKQERRLRAEAWEELARLKSEADDRRRFDSDRRYEQPQRPFEEGRFDREHRIAPPKRARPMGGRGTTQLKKPALGAPHNAPLGTPIGAQMAPIARVPIAPAVVARHPAWAGASLQPPPQPPPPKPPQPPPPQPPQPPPPAPAAKPANDDSGDEHTML